MRQTCIQTAMINDRISSRERLRRILNLNRPDDYLFLSHYYFGVQETSAPTKGIASYVK